MSTKLLELRREKAAKKAEAAHLISIVEGEQRGMTDAERGTFDTLMARATELDGDIRRYEQLEDTSENRHAPNPEAAKIGMTPKEVKQYSLVRAIRAQAETRQGVVDAWQKIAPFELECHKATEERMGMPAQGFFVPQDFVSGAERRDLNVGTPTAGGNMVATDLLAASFIELLRNQLVLGNAGATMLDGLVGNIAIPRQTGGATAYWLAESGAPTESQQTIGQLTMTPHTVGAYTDYSRRLLLQSSLSVEQFVRTDLSAVQALAIDFAGLHGDDGVDANQPDGIAATSGIGSVVGGTNGAAPDWADIVDLESAVSVANAMMGRLAYVTNAKVRGALKKTAIESGYPDKIWNVNGGATPLNGYPVITSNQVSSTLTKGTASGVCSAIFFGNWADLIIGMWGGLDILVDPYTGSTSGTTRVVALQDVDFGVRHAASFAAMLDALTA